MEHAGTALVYELEGKNGLSPLGTLRGDREFSRFGSKLHLSDLDEDGLGMSGCVFVRPRHHSFLGLISKESLQFWQYQIYIYMCLKVSLSFANSKKKK